MNSPASLRYALEHQTVWIGVPQKHSLCDVWLFTNVARTKQFVARAVDVNIVTKKVAETFLENCKA